MPSWKALDVHRDEGLYSLAGKQDTRRLENEVSARWWQESGVHLR